MKENSESGTAEDKFPFSLALSPFVLSSEVSLGIILLH